jgi:hypothetical protein
MTAALRVDTRSAGEAVIVRPVGKLTLETYPALRDVLLKCAASEPTAIVVDLDAMSADRTPLTVFTAVWMRISDWPGIPLLLAAARQPLRAMLDTSSVSRFVSTYRSVPAALQAINAVPARRRRQVPLPGDMTNAQRARRIVAQTCAEWGLTGIVSDAALVASELAENAVKHACSAGWMRLELRGGMFTVAVADTDPRPPRLRPVAERGSGGRGLVVVAWLSRAWGHAPLPQGGKVVWAVLTVPADQ